MVEWPTCRSPGPLDAHPLNTVVYDSAGAWCASSTIMSCSQQARWVKRHTVMYTHGRLERWLPAWQGVRRLSSRLQFTSAHAAKLASNPCSTSCVSVFSRVAVCTDATTT